MSSSSPLNFCGVAIRHRDDGLISLSDIWASQKKPRAKRPDSFVKRKPFQQKLRSIRDRSQGQVEFYANGAIKSIPGVLEVVKGGAQDQQGTFSSVELALDYAKALSPACYRFLKTHLITESSGASRDRSANALPLRIEDFDGKVRFTLDGRIAVYDGISYATGHKNPHEIWNRLAKSHSEVLTKCENFQFPGQGQKETPVADLQGFTEILVLLPGRLAAQVREEAVRTLIRAMNGDPTLVAEILERINNPEDLADIEVAARARREGGLVAAVGTLDNPLTKDKITSEVRNGFGWAGREREMERCLVELASYKGMYIYRQCPARPYSDTSKKAESRRIDLLLADFESQSGVLKAYHFQADYVDDYTVCEVFLARAYPEILIRHFESKHKNLQFNNFEFYIVSPGGITDAGVERLRELENMLHSKCKYPVKLSSMRLDELVWGELYSSIQESRKDSSGQIGGLYLNSEIKPIAEKLCPSVTTSSFCKLGQRKLPNKEQINEKLSPASSQLKLDFD